MGFHVIWTAFAIFSSILIWPFIMYPYILIPYAEQTIGQTVGYHHGPDYSQAHDSAFCFTVVMTVAPIILGAIYLSWIRKRLRADPHLPARKPLMAVLTLAFLYALAGSLFFGWIGLLVVLAFGACILVDYLVFNKLYQ